MKETERVKNVRVYVCRHVCGEQNAEEIRLNKKEPGGLGEGRPGCVNIWTYHLAAVSLHQAVKFPFTSMSFQIHKLYGMKTLKESNQNVLSRFLS